MLRGSQAIASRDNNWRGKVVRLINDPFACAMGSVEPRVQDPIRLKQRGGKRNEKNKKGKRKILKNKSISNLLSWFHHQPRARFVLTIFPPPFKWGDFSVLPHRKFFLGLFFSIFSKINHGTQVKQERIFQTSMEPEYSSSVRTFFWERTRKKKNKSQHTHTFAYKASLLRPLSSSSIWDWFGQRGFVLLVAPWLEPQPHQITRMMGRRDERRRHSFLINKTFPR